MKTNSNRAHARGIDFWPLSRITLYERLPRSHSELQIDQIANSISEFGFINPILINPQGCIIVGAARYLAAKKRNLERVPVIILDHLTDAQERAYRIADNQLALNASWDEQVLRAELQALVDQALSTDLLGFGEEELKRLLSSTELQIGKTDEDAVPEDLTLAVSRTGDLWQLGNHKVLCGDATKSVVIDHLLEGCMTAMTVTDPPYNVRYGSSCQQSSGLEPQRPIANDDLGQRFEPFLFDACGNLLRATAGAVYICMASTELILYSVHLLALVGTSRRF